MAAQKTLENNESVIHFLNSVEDERKRKDCFSLLQMMKKVTGEEPKMWGTSIVGFGKYHYKYASGHEGDAALVGFSPRKQNISIYLMSYEMSGPDNLLSKLGKHKAGKGCLYLNKLEDINQEVLKELIKNSVEGLKKMYGG